MHAHAQPSRGRPAPRRGARLASVLLVAAALAFAPRALASVDILNGITRTPPFDWGFAQHLLGAPPPPGFGYLWVSATAYGQQGWGECFLDNFCFSTAYPLQFNHPQSLYASLGTFGYHCTRPGLFTFDTDLHLDGMAGIRVPVGPIWWRGWAHAWLRIRLRLIVNDLSLAPLPPIQVAVKDTVVYERGSDQTTEAPVTWDGVRVLMALKDIPLSNGTVGGPEYECIVQLLVESEISGYGTNDGGYVFAALAPGNGDWFGYPWNAYGVHVQRMSLNDQLPDTAPPVTTFGPGTFPPPGTSTCMDQAFVTLTASDPGGGFGMGETYWQTQGEPPQAYTGTIVIADERPRFYWSVDRAGNEELPHKSFSYDFIPAPAPPALVSVPDGSGQQHHPIDLVWRRAPGADRYRLQVDDDPGFGSPLASLECADTTSCLTDCESATTYHWRVAAHEPVCDRWGGWSAAWSFTTDVTVGVPPQPVPSAFALRPSVPNPFAGATTVRFELPREARVELDVFDASGARVARLEDGVLPAGVHARVWHGTDDRGRRAAAGLYFVRLRAAGFSATARTILLR